MSEDKPAARFRPCAICGKPRKPEFSPFCSRRCADIDLGRWLKGAYVIPGRAEEAEDEEPPPTTTTSP